MVITSRVDESHYEKITPYIAQKMLYWHCGKSIKIIPHFGINWAKTAGPIFPKCGIIMIFFAAMSAPHFLSQCAADIFSHNVGFQQHYVKMTYWNFTKNDRYHILPEIFQSIITFRFAKCKNWLLYFVLKCNIGHFE